MPGAPRRCRCPPPLPAAGPFLSPTGRLGAAVRLGFCSNLLVLPTPRRYRALRCPIDIAVSDLLVRAPSTPLGRAGGRCRGSPRATCAWHGFADANAGEQGEAAGVGSHREEKAARRGEGRERDGTAPAAPGEPRTEQQGYEDAVCVQAGEQACGMGHTSVSGKQLPEDAKGTGLGLNFPRSSCFSWKKAHNPPGSVRSVSPHSGCEVHVSRGYSRPP